ncbi:Ras association domain protein [Necator americanus]|uniref:Ras association domain protein n=1 Tax=Necator americanus TaxID=51031 RepID=W2TLG9_NECAM|nr:Ras association domain protein [Necator americanus]ETN82945.1 Ras association domain protein [Necator americanus]
MYSLFIEPSSTVFLEKRNKKIEFEIDFSRYATFPGVPQMTTGKLCRVIAHQQGITNPEDHGLYLIVNGFESCLLPHECPDAIRDNLRSTGKPHLFAYKRHDAKIGWPRQVMSTPG